MYDQRTLTEVANVAIGRFNFARQLLGALALVALVLASVGIYAVIAHIVTERTREIGIRIALGGRREKVVRRVMAQALAPAVWGLVVGLVAAAGLTQAMTAILLGVGPNDPVTFSGAALALAGAAFLASYLPARRAARVDPVVTLRAE